MNAGFDADGLDLRDGVAADAAALRELIFPVLESYGLRPDPQGTDADLDDVEAHYGAAGGRFWVLERSGVIVGSCGLYPLGDGVVELRKMYLHPSLRGRGLGRRLLAHALEIAAADGFHTMRLETATALVEAIALYRRNGFTRLAGPPDVPRCDQAWSRTL